ncbi:MAG: transcriptional regulator [Planctomycetota bacterium]|nr:MAG: transcriptional regulator [Planctomycetota bacterium]
MDDAQSIFPPLDPDFAPIALWMQKQRQRASASSSEPLELALTRPDGSCFRRDLRILSATDAKSHAENLRATERTIKHMLWTQGGATVLLGAHGDEGRALADELARLYSPSGEHAFDHEMVGERIYLAPLELRHCAPDELPAAKDASKALGRHLDGCRIGFDLGGSDRKAAALIDGEIVFSEEIEWSPYFEQDPNYHFEGIKNSIERAAAKLPRIDAIGGSAAGVYVDNEPRVASLFRGVSDSDFAEQVRPIFHRLREHFGGVPFELVNDGEVTALAASMSLDSGSILGIAMGTSLAAGYVDAKGCITSWLNELAFCPVDMREDAPRDEWSKDRGCGVQYFSQQAVARLAPLAGIELPAEMPFPERLVQVQERMSKGDAAAARIFTSIGRYLGWSIPWYAESYDIRHLLILGRVTSGAGGQCIIDEARRVLSTAFPELAERVQLTTPDEKMKRHGQAIAAASLPSL